MISGSIEAHLDGMNHPERDLIDAVRRLIATAVPTTVEEIKWNAPSFATKEHFATLNLRPKRGLQLVLHLGAKPRTDIDMRNLVTDPTGLLEWKGPDRAVVTISDLAYLRANAKELQRIAATWARAVT